MIIDLQRRLAEIGRIRIGQTVTSNGKTRPAKLTTFRLTSADRNRINQAARLYGGTPQEWDAPVGKQWEVITETDALGVIVPPSDMAFSQHFELWSRGGCQRRCDGVNESISQGPCLCDPDERECAIHTRLSVMLRDLRGLGVWRIDTQGYYAAVELQGAVEVVRLAAGRGQMLPAQLRLEQRMVKHENEGVKRFAVPVLDIEISPAQLLAGGAAFDPLDAGTLAVGPPRSPIVDSSAPLTPVPETVPEAPVATVAEQAVAKRQRRKGSQQPIPVTGLAPRTVAQAANGVVVTIADDPEGPPTAAMNRKMHALFREAGVTDRDDRLAVTSAILGRRINTSDDIVKSDSSRLIDKLEEWAAADETEDMVRGILNQAQLAAESQSTKEESGQ